MINNRHLFQPWWLTRRELIIWVVALGAICVLVIVVRYRHEAAIEVCPGSMAASRADGARIVSWRLDLNSATANDLVMLPGISPHRAQMLLQERKKRGVFRSIWELSEVPGFTKALIRRLEPLACIGDSAF